MRLLPVIAEAVDGVGESKLRKYKNGRGYVQRELILFVDGPPYGSDGVRRAVEIRREHIHRDADHNYLQERQQACRCRRTAFALPASNYHLVRVSHSLGLPEASLGLSVRSNIWKHVIIYKPDRISRPIVQIVPGIFRRITSVS